MNAAHADSAAVADRALQELYALYAHSQPNAVLSVSAHMSSVPCTVGEFCAAWLLQKRSDTAPRHQKTKTLPETKTSRRQRRAGMGSSSPARGDPSSEECE